MRAFEQKREVYVIGAILGLILVAAGMFWWTGQNTNAVALLPPVSQSAVAENLAPASSLPESIVMPMEKKVIVYIVGAVKAPGVYELSEGARLATAVQMAGGFSAEADREAVNLAQPLQDGLRYYLPRLGETALAAMAEYGGATIAGAAESSKININTADRVTLEKLTNIGPVKAQAIIDYRTKNGPFKSIEDIKKVSGIGAATFESIRDQIVVQ